MNKYILGAGISGLIANYYNKDYKVITPEVGGQLTKSKNLLMTFFIHNHPEIRELLDELKIKYSERRIKILYFYKGKVLDYVTQQQRKKFILTKMCEYGYDSNSYEINDLNLSTSNNYLDILDVDVNLLLEKLKPKEFIYEKVKLINNNRKFIVLQDKEGNLTKLDYDKIISTIPANDFFYMLYNYKNNYHFNYLPATYVLSDVRPAFMKEDGLYYIYDDNLIYNRVQYFSGNYVYEITGFPNEDEIRKNIGNIIDIERRYVAVLKSEEVDDMKNIKFLGRMAEWNHQVHVEEVIVKSKKIKLNEAKQ